MGRGSFRSGGVLPGIVLLALSLAGPSALADEVQPPVDGGAHADYEADAGAILGQALAYDPTFRLDVTFARATVIAFDVPAMAAGEARSSDPAAPRVPRVLSVQSLGPGALTLDPSRSVAVLLFDDLDGLGIAGLPVTSPDGAAEFVVGTAAPLAEGLTHSSVPLDAQHLDIAGLGYLVSGLGLDEPTVADAHGDLFALFALGAFEASDGTISVRQDLRSDLGGQRFALVQLRDAAAHLEASGMAAVLHPATGPIGAGIAVVAHVLGRDVGAAHESSVASDGDHVQLRSATDLTNGLFPTETHEAPSSSDAASQASWMEVQGREALAAGVLAGAVAVLALAGLVGAMGATGKAGLFGLLAPLYARLQGQETLLSGTREAMYKFIVEHPGVNVSDVVKQFQLGWGATVYHLRVLEKAHLVVPQKHGRQVCYFQNGGAYKGQMQGISALRNPNAVLVARAVLAHPGLQQRDVCHLTSLAQPTVSWHLQRLEEAGLVGSSGGARKHYVALDAMHALVERGLLSPSDAAPMAGTAQLRPAPPAGVA